MGGRRNPVLNPRNLHSQPVTLTPNHGGGGQMSAVVDRRQMCLDETKADVGEAGRQLIGEVVSVIERALLTHARKPL